MKPTLTQKFFLSAGETDAEQRMALTVLTAKLIDIATSHANSLGIGNPAMQHLNKGWVLSRLTIEMEKFPEVNDEYSVTTWVESWTRHFSMRDFRIDDAQGRALGYARSIWMVLDTDTHENGGLAHLNLSKDMISGESVPIARQEKHRVIMPPDTSDSQMKSHALKANREVNSHTFLYSDLDAYRHVNTVRYVALLLNQFTLEEFDATMPCRMELSFLHEAHYGQPVEIMRYDAYSPRQENIGSHGEFPGKFESAFYLCDKNTGDAILYARISRIAR